MNIEFYNSDGTDHITISTGINRDNTWLSRACGEGGEFNSKEIDNVIYQALTKYFQENH